MGNQIVDYNMNFSEKLNLQEKMFISSYWTLIFSSIAMSIERMKLNKWYLLWAQVAWSAYRREQAVHWGQQSSDRAGVAILIYIQDRTGALLNSPFRKQTWLHCFHHESTGINIRTVPVWMHHITDRYLPVDLLHCLLQHLVYPKLGKQENCHAYLDQSIPAYV